VGLAVGVALAAPAAAQTTSDSAAADPLRVRAIEIHTHDVFARGEAHGLIPRVANGLHITTRPWIVRRELLVRPGERYDSARIAETERNLRSLRVFRRVRIDSVRTDSGLVLKVETQDAFSTRADFAFGRSGGGRRGLTWSVGAQERNLFGTATSLGARYRQTPDRSAVLFLGQRSRLFRNSIGVAAIYDDRSDGRLSWLSVYQPFLSFSATSSWYLTGEERDERVLRFFEGADDPGITLRRRFWLASGGVSFAPVAQPGGFVRWGIAAQLRRDDYAAETRADTLGRSVSGAVGTYVQWQRARFVVGQGIEGFGREEDVDLSTLVHLGLYLTPAAFGYTEGGIVPNATVRSGVAFRRGFARAAASALARITEAGWVDSGSVHIGGMAVIQPRPRQLAVLYASHGWQRNPMPGGEFDLGLVLGPRGFGRHAFTGDRAFFATAEYRYTITEELLRSAGLGFAAFADYGGAWYAGQRRRTGYAIGLGLRFGVTIDTGLEPIRVDLARIGGSGLERGRWELAIGKGFVFNSLTLRLEP
jgi:hypothetical protein